MPAGMLFGLTTPKSFKFEDGRRMVTWRGQSR